VSLKHSAVFVAKGALGAAVTLTNEAHHTNGRAIRPKQTIVGPGKMGYGTQLQGSIDAVAGVRIQTVADDLDGQRVDNYLLRELKGVPRTRIYRLLRRGEVRVNGGRVRPTHRLKSGDQVRIPPVRHAESDSMQPSDQVIERLEKAILYEDDRLIIIDKPSGLAVHGGSGIAYGLVEALRVMRPRAAFLDLAHRLDRDTSGCLLVAKRRSMLRALHEAFRNNNVDKRYVALVHGRVKRTAMTVTARLAAETGKGGERFVRVREQGQSAKTDFLVRQQFAGQTLLEARLHTGRMHQIRVHAAHIGHPVVMDPRYGDGAADQAVRALGLKRLFLHAESLALELPDYGRIEASAGLPEALESLLDRLATEQD